MRDLLGLWRFCNLPFQFGLRRVRYLPGNLRESAANAADSVVIACSSQLQGGGERRLWSCSSGIIMERREARASSTGRETVVERWRCREE